MRVILASKSPRRKEILEMVGIKFDVISSDLEESYFNNEGPRHLVKRLSKDKVFEVAKNLSEKRETLIIGADTIVLFNGEILGQPKEYKDAKRMLSLLQGKKHRVFTGISVLKEGSEIVSDFSKSVVEFYPMSEEEIDWYISTKEPFDKAGSYGVQGIGAFFIKKINGSYHNVMGFPIDLFYKLIKRLNVDIRQLF
jgi:septum formation protein